MNRFSEFTDRELLALGEGLDGFAVHVANSEEPYTTLFHEWANEAGSCRNVRDLKRLHAERKARSDARV
jgi:hypothetical protein